MERDKKNFVKRTAPGEHGKREDVLCVARTRVCIIVSMLVCKLPVSREDDDGGVYDLCAWSFFNFWRFVNFFSSDIIDRVLNDGEPPKRVLKKFDVCYYCVFQICAFESRACDRQPKNIRYAPRPQSREIDARTRNGNTTMMMYVYYTVVSVRFSIISIRPSGKWEDSIILLWCFGSIFLFFLYDEFARVTVVTAAAVVVCRRRRFVLCRPPHTRFTVNIYL